MTYKEPLVVHSIDRKAGLVDYSVSTWEGPTVPGEIGRYVRHRARETFSQALANNRNASWGRELEARLK